MCVLQGSAVYTLTLYFRSVLGIPVTHCNHLYVNEEASCFDDVNMICSAAPNGSSPLKLDYRDRVYLGQFRTICKFLL